MTSLLNAIVFLGMAEWLLGVFTLGISPILFMTNVFLALALLGLATAYRRYEDRRRRYR